jgi:hypothetical protein
VKVALAETTVRRSAVGAVSADATRAAVTPVDAQPLADAMPAAVKLADAMAVAVKPADAMAVAVKVAGAVAVKLADVLVAKRADAKPADARAALPAADARRCSRRNGPAPFGAFTPHELLTAARRDGGTLRAMAHAVTLVRSLRSTFASSVLLFACGATTTPAANAPPQLAPAVPAAAPANSAPSASAPSAAPPQPAAVVATEPALAAPISDKAVVDATGVEKAETSADGVVKASFPRKDIDVTVDGAKLAPFQGLTSWVAFAPGKRGVAEAMVMGDLVLFEDEVNPVLSVLLEHGVEVTALHNHFFYDTPHVYFMHVGGEGTVAALGGGVKAALEKVAEIRKRSPKPAHGFGAAALPAKSNLDAAKLEAALGVKGQAKDGMFKATMGRKATASCGCSLGKSMGVSTWAGFAGTDDNAVVDGDFAVAEAELQPVLKSLRASGIDIVAIHHHMSGETPRVLFLHYWGRGKALDLAAGVKRALDLTAWDRGELHA